MRSFWGSLPLAPDRADRKCAGTLAIRPRRKQGGTLGGYLNRRIKGPKTMLCRRCQCREACRRGFDRSEERRVGKERRPRAAPCTGDRDERRADSTHVSVAAQ